MTRSIAITVILLAIVVGTLVALAGRARERPLAHVEKVVVLANLSN